MKFYDGVIFVGLDLLACGLSALVTVYNGSQRISVLLVGGLTK